MTTPASDQNEPSKLKKILTSDQDETIMSRLPRGNGGVKPSASPKPAPPPQPVETALVPVPAPTLPPEDTEPPAGRKPSGWRFKFLPAFWTIASAISLTVNIVLLIVVLMLWQNRAPVGAIANSQVGPLLGGLYNNFVLMDEANIQTNIHVEKEIPVKFDLLVSAPADVVLREDVVIDGALVTVATGGLNITNARARIVLPAGQPLPININNLVVPVDKTVLAVLDVPVDIPLNQTELHQPFVGLQDVVKPWYCLMNSTQIVCEGVKNPLEPVFNILPK
jgi:hypothetical protein